MNMNMNATVSVDSAQNKELLWATLQESGAFAGLTRDQFQPVQAAFDRAVQQAAAKSGAAVSLSDANKHIIREFVQVLRAFQSNNPTNTNNPNNPTNTNNPNNPNNPTNPNNPNKKKKVELIYRAEDIQNERVSEFDRQLREKQAEMDSFLTLKKPADVSFVDAEDKPIGDEMSRLIAQELAARERELVQLKPEDIKKAQQWIGTSTAKTNTSTSTSTSTSTNPIKKTVSFSPVTAPVTAQEDDDDPEFEETDSIFSKFKKIHTATAAITLEDVHNKLVELEQDMIARHAELMAKCFCNCGTAAI
jgi:hypothetical protein